MRFEQLLALGIGAFAMVGCGQKGPLYLPDKTGEVVTRPGPVPAQSIPEASSAPAPADAPAPTPAPAEPDSRSKDAQPK